MLEHTEDTDLGFWLMQSRTFAFGSTWIVGQLEFAVGDAYTQNPWLQTCQLELPLIDLRGFFVPCSSACGGVHQRRCFAVANFYRRSNWVVWRLAEDVDAIQGWILEKYLDLHLDDVACQQVVGSKILRNSKVKEGYGELDPCLDWPYLVASYLTWEPDWQEYACYSFVGQ